jgi:hypothetical protein
VAHGAGPVVHGDLAGGYAVSEWVGNCVVALCNVRSNFSGRRGGSESGIKGLVPSD